VPLTSNRELVRSRVDDIQEQLQALRGHAALPDRAFLDDPREIRSARYSLIVLVEAAAAICAHICARALARPWTPMRSASNAWPPPGSSTPRWPNAWPPWPDVLVHGDSRVDDAHVLW